MALAAMAHQVTIRCTSNCCFRGRYGLAIASYSEALSHSGKEGYTGSKKLTHKGKKRLACGSLGRGNRHDHR
jgi:hypothetical protein